MDGMNGMNGMPGMGAAPEMGAPETPQVTVTIEKYADGSYKVGSPSAEPMPMEGEEGMEGMEPAEGGEMGMESGGMNPAKDLNDAFMQAKEIFSQPISMDGGPSPFEDGFAAAKPSVGVM